MGINSADNNSIYIGLEINNDYTGIEVYRSKEYDGEYSLIKTAYGVDNTWFVSHYGTMYYYKARYFNEVNGKKIYSEMSDVTEYFPSLSHSFTLPFVLTGDGYSVTINSLDYELVKSTKNDSTFRINIGISESVSDSDREVPLNLTFEPAWGDETTTICNATLNLILDSGTVNWNYMPFVQVTIPNYYTVVNIEK